MLAKDDLMKFPKKRLCELLLEEWSKKENTLVPFDFPAFGIDDCYRCGPCTKSVSWLHKPSKTFSGSGTTI